MVRRKLDIDAIDVDLTTDGVLLEDQSRGDGAASDCKELRFWPVPERITGLRPTSALASREDTSGEFGVINAQLTPSDRRLGESLLMTASLRTRRHAADDNSVPGTGAGVIAPDGREVPCSEGGRIRCGWKEAELVDINEGCMFASLEDVEVGAESDR